MNDTFREAGIEVDIAALGALIPAHAALGQGDPQSYVSALQRTLMAGAAPAAAGAIVTGWLLGRGASVQPSPSWRTRLLGRNPRSV